jgi:hypothetical protein
MLPPTHRSPWPAAVIVVVAALATPACTSSAPYRRLAEAGAAYAGAVGSLSTAAATLAVDGSSARLLQDDALANVDLQTLRRFDEEDSHRLAVLARLATHARLMRRYFSLVGDLAAGRAGRTTATALGRLAAALDTAGEALRRTGAGAGVAAAVGPVQTGAGFYGRCLARKELTARAGTLRRELATQTDVLAALEQSMRRDAELLAAVRRQWLVVDPLLAEAPVADPERWMADRRALLDAAPALDELAAAARAAASLATALETLAGGRLDLARLDEVVTDVEAIGAALDAAGLRREGQP